MKVKCIKDVPFTSAKAGNIYQLTEDGCTIELRTSRDVIYTILENRKVHPSLTEYFEIVPEEVRDFEWYLKKAIENIQRETSILNRYPADVLVEAVKNNSITSITSRFLISETYRTIAEELNNGWAPDWKNINEKKWVNYYIHGCMKQEWNTSCQYFNRLYFKSETLAKQAADIMGKYLMEL